MMRSPMWTERLPRSQRWPLAMIPLHPRGCQRQSSSAAIPAGSLLHRERILQPGVGKIFDDHFRHGLEQLELVALFRDPEYDHSLQGRTSGKAAGDLRNGDRRLFREPEALARPLRKPVDGLEAFRAFRSLSGTNNDCYGFIQNVRQEQPGWRPDVGPIVVIGAGGGSRAVCYGLAQEGAREIRLVNRTLARAKGIAEEFGGPIKALPWEQRHDALEGAAMVVNTTSCGMVGQPALDIKLDKLPKTALAADIIYIPLETPFLAAARKRGNRTGNVLGMLWNQRRPAWKAWFGIEPEVTAELRAMVERTI